MKSKILLIAVLLMVSFFKVPAQNLVPNYSFEDTIHCPIYGEFQGYVTGWGGYAPGYFSPFCYDAFYGGSPQNIWGFQNAHSGNVYAGIYTFIDSTYDKPDYDTRDYLQAQLTSSLIVGLKYYVTFYISLGDSEKYACNNIGAYFSDSSLDFSSRKVLSSYIPQMENDTTHQLTDKVNWMKISGDFVAQGGEQYITIGNFNDDAHSDTVFVNSLAHTENLWTDAYYYVDDVIVSLDSNYADSLITATENINKPKDAVEVFPNPSNGILTISQQGLSSKEYVEIYNMMGETIYSETILSESTQIDIHNQSAGIYLYRIISDGGKLLSQGKLIIQH